MTLSNQEFSNVYDLGASRKVKQATGQGRAIRSNTPESSSFAKHADEAMAMGNPTPAPKKSAFDKTMEYLGL